ncbi:hypothetical protein EN868_03205 [Mesorhizobium sp. M2D.F.Ca.ET.225.01.1.1]|uniref:hypothetical protein n=1 Tax=unclassified Mesorhizobium TaxID=325217 RepID=UPI000FD60680|nr:MULTISPECIES: hypothetical protein [unclassified Mesorhizobium]TGP65469.1 hypothetical protein EN869_003210 [Mesorhizobium sp. M2D.F.Ca.ET.226.01.1.1]TGP71948.1 hypothetical protein EN868_03205 [Mesorhizobium sp. M2D.F.Ca.ET.225.01.1.1]
MKFRTVSALALCATFAGCQTTPPSIHPTQAGAQPTVKQTVKRQLSAEEVTVIQKGVRESLKDPDSARFGNMVAAQEDANSSWVCGTVNAKNSFGGYTGDKPFMGMLTHLAGGKGKVLRTFMVSAMGGTDTETYVALSMCKQYGVL